MLQKGVFNQQDADLLTLGNYIAGVMQTEEQSNEVYMKLATEFTRTRGDKLHKLVKNILVGSSSYDKLPVVRFILDYKTDETIISKQTELRCPGAVCTITLYKNLTATPDRKLPFYAVDFTSYCSTFITIDRLESIAPGAGRSLINQVIHMVDVPILIQAGFLYYGDYEIEARDNIDSEVLDKLVPYYESIGFKNINDIVGNYEDSVVMLYSGKDILQGTTRADSLDSIEVFN